MAVNGNLRPMRKTIGGLSPRFSMNYGIRYEIFTPFVEIHNHLAALVVDPNITKSPWPCLDRRIHSRERRAQFDRPPQLHRLYPAHWHCMEALSHGGPVIRAGYGMFYNGSSLDQVYLRMVNQPPWAQASTFLTSATQLLTLENGFPPAANRTLSQTPLRWTRTTGLAMHKSGISHSSSKSEINM